MNAPANVAPRERPILMSGPLVVETRADRKTQTRRLYKPRRPAPWEVVDDDGDGVWPHLIDEAGDAHRVACPYGVPGDRLWVRESWTHEDDCSAPVLYRADADENGEVAYQVSGTGGLGGGVAVCKPRRWRPSIHMPRWASRLTLEITGVRIERLQDISESEAHAEGVASGRIPADEHGPERIGYVLGKDDGVCTLYPTARDAFARGWDVINGRRASWENNPWVWVIGFRRVCQCQSDIEDPGPGHLPSCPWSDPNYSAGFP